MTGLESFKRGIKPVYLCSHRFENRILCHLLNLGFPNILCYELPDFDIPDKVYDRGTLFFHNEQQKEEYITRSKEVATYSKEETILLGQTLGYPPVACQFFVDAKADPNLAQKKAGYHYITRLHLDSAL